MSETLPNNAHNAPNLHALPADDSSDMNRPSDIGATTDISALSDMNAMSDVLLSQQTEADLHSADLQIVPVLVPTYSLAVRAPAPYTPATTGQRFSTNPEQLFDQAQRIEIWHIPFSDVDSDDRAGITSGTNSDAHILIFARDTKSGESVDGCEIAAYLCAPNGRVHSWHRRYAENDLNFPLAAQKLRCRIINGMAILHLTENL